MQGTDKKENHNVEWDFNKAREQQRDLQKNLPRVKSSMRGKFVLLMRFLFYTGFFPFI